MEYTRKTKKASTKFAFSGDDDRFSIVQVIFVLFLVGGLLALRGGADRPTTLGSLPLVSSSVTAQEQKSLTWNDAIRSVFPADEAGRMIRICIKENGRQAKDAINFNKNGTYDYSYCQVNSVHKPSIYSDAEWKKLLEDPMFHAKTVRKIFINEGWNAWSVYKFGLTK